MGNITIVGTGVNKDQLTLAAAALFGSNAEIILHTGRCGAAEYLDEHNIAYRTLDDLYDDYEDFDEHAEMAAETVQTSAEGGDVIYAVMDIRDQSALLLIKAGAKVVPGPVCEGTLLAYANEGTQLFAAADWENMRPDACLNTIVREIDSRELACEVKLRLMEAYPDDVDVIVENVSGIRHIKLYDLDRLGDYDHRFSALVRAEHDVRKLNDVSLRALVNAARTNDEIYQDCDFADISEAIVRAAGAIAYAEDRGEFTAADIMVDARDVIMG